MAKNIPSYIRLEEFSTVGQDAITSLLLEGIVPSEKTIEHLKLLDSGQITPEEFRELGGSVTLKTFADTDAGKNLVRSKDAKEMFKKLGI